MIKKVAFIFIITSFATISAMNSFKVSPGSVHETPNDALVQEKIRQEPTAIPVVTSLALSASNVEYNHFQALLESGANPFVQGRFGAPTILGEAKTTEQVYRDYAKYIKDDSALWRQRYRNAKHIRLSLTIAYQQAKIDEYDARK